MEEEEEDELHPVVMYLTESDLDDIAQAKSWYMSASRYIRDEPTTATREGLTGAEYLEQVRRTVGAIVAQMARDAEPPPVRAAEKELINAVLKFVDSDCEDGGVELYDSIRDAAQALIEVKKSWNRK